jgi:hypothetical protein
MARRNKKRPKREALIIDGSIGVQKGATKTPCVVLMQFPGFAARSSFTCCRRCHFLTISLLFNTKYAPSFVEDGTNKNSSSY